MSDESQTRLFEAFNLTSDNAYAYFCQLCKH